ncbi:hypothetical protein [Conyzicola sp.]|uniref:hypothetical protein n=1 Tax=Conyzicola sp. TaxID=1969404 RepID=UPI003989D6E4
MRLSNALIAPAAEKAATWSDHLQSMIVPDWRPDEFDLETLVYTPDHTKPEVALDLCSRPNCGILIERGPICTNCRQAWTAMPKETRMSREEWQTTPRVRAPIGVGCLIDGCPRSHSGSGMCTTHGARYRSRRKSANEADYTVDLWISKYNPQPLAPLPACLYPGCIYDKSHDNGLCNTHSFRFNAWRKKHGADSSEDLKLWFRLWVEPEMDPTAGTTFARAMATPFGLLRDPVRWELLYALQQRDLKGAAGMSPVDIRVTYLGLRHSDIATTVGADKLGRENIAERDGGLRGLLNDLQWFVDEAHRKWSGVDPRDPRIIRFQDLELRKTSKRVGRNAGLDLREIQTQWILDAIGAWVRGAPRGIGELPHIQSAWTIADETLRARGTAARSLAGADMNAIVKEIRTRWSDPRAQGRQLLALSRVINFARADDEQQDVWGKIAPQFSVDPERHAPIGKMASRAKNPDEPFRFVPQPIVDWVMDHLGLLVRADAYRTAEAQAMIFVHERCGRRTGETTRLEDDCISYDTQGSPYLEWQEGKPPFGSGKRLPIHQETHDVIRDWQKIKREAGVDSKWLFPSSFGSNDQHYGHGYLGDRINDLIAIISEKAPFTSAVEGAEGNLIYFDLSTIDPYSFRHAFAQRLADATDADGRPTTTPDVLQDYMGHKSFVTTMAYFSVTAKRRKKALSAIPPRRLNLLGEAIPIDRERDGFGKLAVTLGSCTEPQNVAAGGEACSLNHACESCPFFLVDPLERDGMAAKRTHLQVQLERARIIRASAHLLEHYAARIADCTAIINGIDNYIDTLSDDERTAIKGALDQMADVRRRATSPRRIDLRKILREKQNAE